MLKKGRIPVGGLGAVGGEAGFSMTSVAGLRALGKVTTRILDTAGVI
jgi:hypothetical protein